MMFKDYIKNKRIALIGNACKDYQLIDYDIVIRLNNGYKEGNLNVLGLSLYVDSDILKNLNLDYVIWCTPKRYLVSEYVNEHGIFYPVKRWEQLYLNLGARPSTGCMMLDFLIKIGGYKQLDIYNFDFWQTPNKYSKVIHTASHSPKAEEAYFMNICTINDNIRLIK